MCKHEQIEKFTRCENQIYIENKFDIMLFWMQKKLQKTISFYPKVRQEKNPQKKILRKS